MDNLTDLSVIKDIMTKYGFSFSKSLGQNFLINPSVCPRIAEEGNAKEGFGIIEIGTGFGVLTNELCKRADKVCAIEIDERLIPVIRDTLSEYNNLTVINADVMKTDLKKVIEENFGGLKVSVCANLPYYITSPVIMYLLESDLPIESITVMVQKEAAERLCAPCGSRECGAISYAVNYYSEPKKLFNVSRGSFYPSPNVDSAVIRLDIRKDVPFELKDKDFFFKVIKGAFSQRRKTLANAVSSSLGINKEIVKEAIGKTGLDENVRPEKLSLEEMARFSDNLNGGKNGD